MMKRLNPNVYYLEGHDSEGPNPKIGIILGTSAVCLIDVSNEKAMLGEALSFVSSERPSAVIKVVLTHFHNDHIANLEYLPSSLEVYSSKNTARYLKKPINLVQKDLILDLGGVTASILPVPSLHAKGCLDVLCGPYLFVGDSLYFRRSGTSFFYNREISAEMEKRYEAIPFEETIPSHEGPAQNKNEVMLFLHDLVKRGLPEKFR